jgi:4,5:9,10-diseco-3-hydroxy-5,9,17-trioxoandrosta-1(10),2-diene-4-oate hydrolase
VTTTSERIQTYAAPRQRPGSTQKRSGGLLAAVLGIDALLHLYLATGLRWPAADTRHLSIALLGMQIPFNAGLLLGLAAMLIAASVLVQLARRIRHGPLSRLANLATAAVTAGVLTRGLLGVLWVLPLGFESPSFHWLNLLLYTPICLAASVSGLKLLAPRLRVAATALPVAGIAAILFSAYAAAPTPDRGYRPSEALGGVPSHYVNTSLARFHYLVGGHGSPVVLLSPGSAWAAAWLSEFRVLTHNHTVYVVDMPGQGFTVLHDRGFAFDLPAMTRAVGTFLDAVHLRTVALAGNSWSGGWALAYAQRHPQRVSRLLLLAPSGLAQPDPLSWELFKLPVLGRVLANLGAVSRSQADAGVRALFVHKRLATERVLLAMWAPNTLPVNLQATFELEARLDWAATQSRLHDTRQPTLIIWGQQDTVLPVSQASTFGRQMPNASVHVLDQCGHALTVDCPARVTALMKGFLDGS